MLYTELLQRGEFLHIAFDGTTKNHNHILVLQAFSYVDNLPVQKFVGVRFLSKDDAQSQTTALISMLREAKLAEKCTFGAVTVDSCNTNIGDKGGIVHLLGKELSTIQGREVKLPIMHCTCHIWHNTLGHAITETFGASQTMKRAGMCAVICHVLERVSKKTVQWR